MTSRTYQWLEKVASLLYVVFCFELGVFLLVFPWLRLWENSFFSNLDFSLVGYSWEQIWDSSWFRGAFSGLGLVNIFISLAEVVRLRRYTDEHESQPAGSTELQ